jgi:glycosyltransferase involved in cell wall biosynthesis
LIGDKNKVFAASGVDENDLQQNNITVLHHVDSKGLAEMYSKAEVVVSLSEYEGFGIPVLEGLFFGCKVLCSDIPVYRELFSDMVTFCPPKDPAAIAAALEQMTVNHMPPNHERVNLLLKKYNYAQSAQTIIEKVGSLRL